MGTVVLQQRANILRVGVKLVRTNLISIFSRRIELISHQTGTTVAMNNRYSLSALIALVLILGLTSANAQFVSLLSLDKGTTGSDPQGSLIADEQWLYGMTTYGGANNMGTVFKVAHDGTGFTKLLDFDGSNNGKNPYGSLLLIDNVLYGTAVYGGSNEMGTVFRLNTDGTEFKKLWDFDGANSGLYPYSSLITDGTYLYGTTNYGGANNMGTVYRVSTSGSGATKLVDFVGVSNGRGPFGSLVAHGSLLYGMTAYGGAKDKGTVFSMKPDGSEFVKLYDFDGDNSGMNPFGSLVSDGVYLYGLTAYGGRSDGGTAFKLLLDGSGFVKLMDFTGSANGRRPFGTLTRIRSALFGMTDSGGSLDVGTVFTILPDGSGYQNLFDFTGNQDGSYPYGSLLHIGTALYGMTRLGGSNGNGVVFKFGVSVVSVDETREYNGSLSLQPNPFTTSTVVKFDVPVINATLILYDRIGQPVVQCDHVNGSSFTLNRSALASGVYLLRLITHSGEVITKNVVITE